MSFNSYLFYLIGTLPAAKFVATGDISMIFTSIGCFIISGLFAIAQAIEEKKP